VTQNACNQTRQPVPDKMFSQDLILRVNELYHDFQAGEFNKVHLFRHRVEKRFWQFEVAPRLSRAGAEFGVDLCTGTGFVPGILLGQLGSSVKIMCVDLSSKALERNRASLRQFGQRLITQVGDAAALPIPDGAANWISLNAGLHHIPNPERVLKEIDRVLKDGGFFFLGFEPNMAFFLSRFLVGLERFIWHAFWYLSPRNNLRRIRQKMGLPIDAYEQNEHLEDLNHKLLSEGLLDAPLTLEELRHIVDFYTHDGDDHERKAGFNPYELISHNLANYSIEKIIFSDYGGEMMRKFLWLRAIFDCVMGRIFPRKGRLFSWIVRKSNLMDPPASNCDAK